MTKALFKKQMMEMFSFLFQDKKKNTIRKGTALALCILLYIVLFGLVSYIFGLLGFAICEPLKNQNLEWLYFSITGLIAVFFGVFGSVFNSYSSLYQAKDNEILLAMPIPPGKLIFIRLLGVYFMGLLYEMIVMVPILAIYYFTVPLSFSAVVFPILTVLVLSVFILILSTAIGWIVALISSKTKNKSYVTVIISLVFLGLYFYLYNQASSIIQSFLAYPQVVGDFVKSNLYPIYAVGQASAGDILSFLIIAVFVFALLALVYYVLSKSFTKITTTKKGEKKKQYKEEAVIKTGNANNALFRKELKRFTSSSSYMLNCGLGTVLMIVAAVTLLFNTGNIKMLANVLNPLEGFFPMIACAAICMISSMNDITAPSVSLEGKSIWIVQSMPVTPWQVLCAKLKLHLVLTMIPTLILTAVALFIISPAPIFTALVLILVSLFVFFSAEFGLVVNLKSPNLDWTSEIVPIKQSLGVMLSLFSSWIVIILLGIIYAFVYKFVSPLVYMILSAVLLLALSILLAFWLKNKGTKIFAKL